MDMDAIYTPKCEFKNKEKRVLVTWNINPELFKNEDSYYFEIFRSYNNTDDDFEFLGETRLCVFYDETLNFYSKWREVVYIIKAKYNDEILKELKVSLYRSSGNIIINKIHAEFNKVNVLKLKNIGVIFSETDDKIPCPECYDETFNESNDKDCKRCGGIGFLKAYSSGVRLAYEKGKTPEIPTSKNGISETENTVKSIKVVGKIPFHPGDLFLDRNNKIHRIENVTPACMFNEVVFQGLYIKELDKIGPEYNLDMSNIRIDITSTKGRDFLWPDY